MYPDYDDIRTRVTERPAWFGRHGVPRYGSFHPAMSNIYASEAVLFEIACQGCGARARIGFDLDPFALAAYDHERQGTDAYHRYPTAEAPSDLIGYGDFPRGVCDEYDHECVGVTMTTAVTRILEYWIHEGTPADRQWVRHSEYEFDYGDPWAEPNDDSTPS